MIKNTTDYDKFRLLDANREVNRRHVVLLMQAMEEDGNFTRTQPILVNERMEVIDGQHRLAACKELGIPAYYTMIKGMTVHDARKMNVLHRRWQGDDYIDSYATEGRPAYVKLSLLMNDYDLPISTVILYAKGKQYSGYNSDFRRGELEDFDMEPTRARLEQLSELIELTDAFKSKVLAVALLELMRSAEYDQARMVAKVAQIATDVRPFQNVGDNMRSLENIFNNGYSTNRARLF